MAPVRESFLNQKDAPPPGAGLCPHRFGRISLYPQGRQAKRAKSSIALLPLNYELPLKAGFGRREVSMRIIAAKTADQINGSATLGDSVAREPAPDNSAGSSRAHPK